MRIIAILILALAVVAHLIAAKRKWYRIDKSRKFNDFVNKIGGCLGDCGNNGQQPQYTEKANRLRKEKATLCAYDKAYNENRNNDCNRHNEHDCIQANCCWQPNRYLWCEKPKW